LTGGGSLRDRACRLVALYERVPAAVRWLLVLGWALLLWYESAQPPTHGPHSAFNNWYHNAAHVPAFGLLALLVLLAAGASRGAWVGIAAAACYGVVDEIHQSFTPGRDASWKDVLSDTVGGCLVVAVFLWWIRGRTEARTWALALVPLALIVPTIAAFW
jgi:VanZ family protein